MTMTSRERITAAMELKIPDKTPMCPRIDPKWLENAGPKLAAEFLRVTDCAVYYDLLPDAVLYFGQEAAERLHSETAGSLRHETLDTPKGPLTRLIHIETDMMDWAEKHFFETPDDVEKAMSIPYVPPQLDLAGYWEWDARVGDDGIVMAHLADALCCPGLWFSPDNYVIHACVESTELVLKLMERVNRSILDVAGYCLDNGVRYFMQSGAELASQTMIGPEWCDQFVVQFDGPVAELVRARGGYTWCHCHGKIAGICEKLAGMGIHVLSPCEKPPQGNITLADLKRLVGGQVCLAGNLDDLALLASGDLARVRAEALDCLQAGMPGGGFMLGGTEGCVFSENTAAAYLFMASLRDEFGRY